MKKLVEFLFEVGSLRKIARSHRQRLRTDDMSDNIASHSHRVSVIGYFLAQMEKADPFKTAVMCIFHDLSESRSGDINWIHKKYVKVFDEEITEAQAKGLPASEDFKKLLNEYEKRESKESKIAKDADVLDQILLCREYVSQGNVVAKYWLRNQQRWLDMLSTKSAKKLVPVIFATGMDDWANHIDTSKRR